ncbi:helix-turn-helix domain-containing protein [Streptomyces altiplanensis]
MSALPNRVVSLERYLQRPGQAPVLLKRLVGRHLAALREEAGLSQGQAAKRAGFSNSKICRIEQGRGKKPAEEKDVALLLGLYGAGPDEASLMRELLHRAEGSVWWQRYSHTMLPEWLEEFIGLQESAETIRTYEVQLIPGLLQTESFARTVISLGLPMAGRAEVEQRTQLRMRRQEMLARPNPPSLWALIDESALHRTLGRPDVMREQLQHLLDVSRLSDENSAITLQVVPRNAPEALSSNTPFTHLRFPEQDVPDVVYLEQLNGAEFLERPEATVEYRALLDRLSAAALTPRATRELLKKTIQDLSA